MLVGEGVFQARTERLSSTTLTAFNLAKDKTAASMVLARRGVPVAPHIGAHRQVACVGVRDGIGLPVVVKPRRGRHRASGDGGLEHQGGRGGSFAARRADRWVGPHRAPHRGRGASGAGRRRAHDRGGPAVAGGGHRDGTSTVDQLLDRANADPRRREDNGARFSDRYDGDTERVLRTQGWTLESRCPRPARGAAEVRLQLVAGGTAHDVTE